MREQWIWSWGLPDEEIAHKHNHILHCTVKCFRRCCWFSKRIHGTASQHMLRCYNTNDTIRWLPLPTVNNEHNCLIVRQSSQSPSVAPLEMTAKTTNRACTFNVHKNYLLLLTAENEWLFPLKTVINWHWDKHYWSFVCDTQQVAVLFKQQISLNLFVRWWVNTDTHLPSTVLLIS